MGVVDAAFRKVLTFAIGASVSNAVDISVLSLRGAGILMKSTDWIAADIGFQVSDDGVTFWDLKRNDSTGLASEGVRIVGVSTTVAYYYSTPPDVWAIGGFKWLRLTSRNTGAFATAVAQTGTIKNLELVTLQ